jgi:mannose-1-phosphate guanylyltransferase
MPSHRYGVILAGGRGTRFWPRSRTRSPKQLLSFLNEKTLLQETVDRLRPVIPPDRLWILTNEHLRREVMRQLPAVPAGQVIAEPAQRNTAPCLGLASKLIAEHDPEAVLGVFPADHHISDPEAFRKYLKPAFGAAEAGDLVTLGIQPRWAETGYGYLEFPRGIVFGDLHPYPLASFREKPKRKQAEAYCRAGIFCWNAGMFFWRAAVFLECVRRFQPKTSALLASLPALGARGFRAALARVYPNCTDISVDHAVMEPAAAAGRVVGLATADIGWSDLGSWNAVYELVERDTAGNASLGDAVFEAAKGCYVQAGDRLVALVGVKNLIVVDTSEALLIVSRSSAQKVGSLVKTLEARRRGDLL